jgi:hypothetical protein
MSSYVLLQNRTRCWAGNRKEMCRRKGGKEKKETRQGPGSDRKEIVVASRPVSPEYIPLRDPPPPPPLTYGDHGGRVLKRIDPQ